ncbi:MAG: serine hydrolase domain-containing protein [Deltaproteobacteria bacterium]
MSGQRWQALDRVFDAALQSGATPGASLLVARGREVLLERCYGLVENGGPPVCETTLYDLASLTKPLATLPALLILAAAGRLDLDAELAGLVGHRSGLPAWKPYYESLGATATTASPAPATAAARRQVLDLAQSEALEGTPGGRAVYSDVGYIRLGRIVEEVVAGRAGRLDEFVGEAFFGLLEGCKLRFVNTGLGQTPLARAAPCGYSAWRGETVRGTVCDDNAYALGGVAGHAGLFGTAADVHAVVAEYLAAYQGRGRVLDTDLVRRCWQRPEGTSGSDSWRLGWDSPTAGESTAGTLISDNSVGHLGYTGTSVWVDLERGVHVVLLTNRVHPDWSNRGIDSLRPAVHDAVFEALA